jgi:hypothetical protein
VPSALEILKNVYHEEHEGHEEKKKEKRKMEPLIFTDFCLATEITEDTERRESCLRQIRYKNKKKWYPAKKL